MNFELSDEQRMAVENWRRFLEREIRPITDLHRDSYFPKDVLKRLLKATGEYGVGNGWVPEEGGGLGLDFVTSGLLYEELARVSADLAGAAFVNEGAAIKVFHAGSPEIKERYLGPTLAGDLIGCSAISEPNVGSHVRGMRTKAVRQGDCYRITGEKLWISNSSVADYVVLVAATGEQEFTMFLVDREEHGFETREVEKLGLNGWSLGQIIFNDVVVPASNILGKLGGGLRETMRGFERSRCFISLLALGLGRASLDAAIEYAKQRVQFDKPIGAHQLVQQLIAEMAIELEASRLMVFRALALLDRQVGSNTEAAMAKAFTTEAVQRITSKAIQVHGAFGLSREFPVERYFRSARMLTIPDGTTQINYLIIGRKLLGLDAFA
ncbi:acyl-CoA dehydrogenase family protein [uncultured Ferrovibrio sp.]|jgi:alkylation response protein AidB-like acyl-CoA dehydrogenase|uniref:acyl-CoA dehydrogenase family protein n=1 Tax=uncultured Ferrovibrio sp. TaxID=1576913 RepID=UPI00263763C3|nr:acyl-CoA dehydrogenase family protein [uncultured Ferrovibrio sp.]